MGTDMGTAGPVIKVGVTSRGAAPLSGSSVRRSVEVRSAGAPSAGDAVAEAAGGGRVVVTSALRSWRC